MLFTAEVAAEKTAPVPLAPPQPPTSPEAADAEGGGEGEGAGSGVGGIDEVVGGPEDGRRSRAKECCLL